MKWLVAALLLASCGGTPEPEWRPPGAYLAPANVPLTVGMAYRVVFTIGDIPSIRTSTVGYPCVVTDRDGVTRLNWGVWRIDPPHRIRAWIAGLRGVGTGFLDTLEALYGRPIQYDTTTGSGHIGGQTMPAYRGDTARVVLNPAAWVRFDATLAHEIGGHLVFGLGGSRGDEVRAEDVGQAILRQSGRVAEFPYRTADAVATDLKVRVLLETLRR